jgi:hypothetical protein
MKSFSATLVGIRPLLLANRQAADPLSPWFKIFKQFRAKRTKTEDDYLKNDENMFQAHLYVHPETKRLYIPVLNVHQLLIDGGAKNKKKDIVKGGVFFDEQFGFELQYDGPKDIEKLQADPRFRLRRLVPGSTGGASPVVYPLLPTGWKLPIVGKFDESVLEDEDMTTILDSAGMRVGLGGWHPMFGRFKVENLKFATVKE